MKKVSLAKHTEKLKQIACQEVTLNLSLVILLTMVSKLTYIYLYQCVNLLTSNHSFHSLIM